LLVAFGNGQCGLDDIVAEWVLQKMRQVALRGGDLIMRRLEFARCDTTLIVNQCFNYHITGHTSSQTSSSNAMRVSATAARRHWMGRTQPLDEQSLLVPRASIFDSI
jgi:hypothetical protein